MSEKIIKLRQKMKEEGIEALLVTTPFNLRYVTGFTGTTGLALLSQEENFFVTDARYTEQAAKQVPDFTIIQNKGPILKEVEKLIESKGFSNLAFEEGVSYQQYMQLEELIPAECDLFCAPAIIEDLRQIKTPAEIAAIQKACEITDKAFEYILGKIKPGVTELELANELDFFMRKLGASGTSFETIVASGYRSAMPHGVASEKKLENNELITFDFGCYYDGYVSDMTRTVALGAVDEELRKIYDITLEAQKRVIDFVAAGKTVAACDAVARDYMGSFGYADKFTHSLGHGIGLEIHEGVILSQNVTATLMENQVITDEPGIYLSGKGGVRIEDDLIVTKDGCIVLNKAPKEFIQL